jgi:hypothetical protein
MFFLQNLVAAANCKRAARSQLNNIPNYTVYLPLAGRCNKNAVLQRDSNMHDLGLN